MLVHPIAAIGDQTAGTNELTFKIDRGQFVLGRKFYDQIAMNHSQRARRHDQAAIWRTCEVCDTALDLSRIA